MNLQGCRDVRTRQGMVRLLVAAGLLALPLQDEAVQKLLDQLESDDIGEREKAETALREVDGSALSALEHAATTGRPETRARLERALSDVRLRRAWAAFCARRGTKDDPAGEGAYAAVQRALDWLAKHQQRDGRWSASAPCAARRCGDADGEEKHHDVGVTALAVCAFLGAGIVPGEASHGKSLHAGLEYLRKTQEKGGLFNREGGKPMYSHAWATLAMAEAAPFGDTWKESAQRAVHAMEAARTRKGWRYSIEKGGSDNDTSVTLSAVQALMAARTVGLGVSDDALKGARAWFDEVTEENYYRVGYTHKDSGKRSLPNASDSFNFHEGGTVGAGFARILMGATCEDVRLSGAAQLALRDLPAWREGDVDFMYWYWGTAAFWQFGAKYPKEAAPWHKAVLKALLDNQQKGGCEAGSWDPADKWSSDGGRVYATAINTSTLETCYRHRRMWEAKK